MNYDLALELKEAGFPETPIFGKDEPHGHYMEGNVESDETGIITTNSVYMPTLSELIAACGRDFNFLQPVSLARRDSRQWEGQSSDQMGNFYRAQGATPEEAIARLYLALKKS